MKKNNQEQNFELRSEKVRSIVGQVPSSLVFYSITSIVAVLLSLMALFVFLPYTQVYNGTTVIHDVVASPLDSVNVLLKLRFDRKRPNNVDGQILYFRVPHGMIEGQIQSLSSVCDTLGCQESLCRFKLSDIKNVENQIIDFQIKCLYYLLKQIILDQIQLRFSLYQETKNIQKIMVKQRLQVQKCRNLLKVNQMIHSTL